MSTVVVRYRTKPEHADENQRLVEAVFAELAATTPAGQFLKSVESRCEPGEGPNPQPATLVGSYGAPGAPR